jgi:hypothetical protein
LAPYASVGLHLTPDPDERLWTDDTKASRIRSTVWDDHSGRGRNDEGPQGDRLELHASIVAKVLRELKRDLVIQVTVTRENRDDYGEKDKDERQRRLSTYFLVRPGPDRLRVS